jgi:hypothetical protein
MVTPAAPLNPGANEPSNPGLCRSRGENWIIWFRPLNRVGAGDCPMVTARPREA